MALVQNGFDQLELARKRSVKLGDIPPGGATVLQLFVPSTPARALLPADLPFTAWQRDRYLSLTPRADAQWGAAIGISVAKVASLAWDVSGDIRIRSRRGKEICMTADSAVGQGGWVHYISKQVRDFSCTNMGPVTEIVRETLAYGSRLVGINHLPAIRCRRTGDPNKPIIYIGKDGRQHVLRDWQVMYFSDLPDPDELTFGGGLCAAERAYPQIIKMAALENYVYEKISGSRPLAIHIINGLRTDQLEDAIKSAEADQRSAGFTSYMGAVVLATIKPDAAPSVATIPLAELPDGFDAVNERARADLIYANALGLDIQDLVPLSNTPLGTSGQSQVLAEKARGKGLMLFRQSFVHGINQLVFDSKTKFLFTERDYDDQIKRSTIAQRWSIVAMNRIKAGITSPPEERQIMVENKELPREFIDTDLISGSSLSDTDKIGLDDRDIKPLPPPAPPAPPTRVPDSKARVPVDANAGSPSSAAAGSPSTSASVPALKSNEDIERSVSKVIGQIRRYGIARLDKSLSTKEKIQHLPDNISGLAQMYFDFVGEKTDEFLDGNITQKQWEEALVQVSHKYAVAGFLVGIRRKNVHELTEQEFNSMYSSVNKFMESIDDIITDFHANKRAFLKDKTQATTMGIMDIHDAGLDAL